MEKIDRDGAVDKFLAKYCAAHPKKQLPSRERVEQYVDNRIKQGKHIVYPLVGRAWSQAEWQDKRTEKSGDKK